MNDFQPTVITIHETKTETAELQKVQFGSQNVCLTEDHGKLCRNTGSLCKISLTRHIIYFREAIKEIRLNNLSLPLLLSATNAKLEVSWGKIGRIKPTGKLNGCECCSKGI